MADHITRDEVLAHLMRDSGADTRRWLSERLDIGDEDLAPVAVELQREDARRLLRHYTAAAAGTGSGDEFRHAERVRDALARAVNTPQGALLDRWRAIAPRVEATKGELEPSVIQELLAISRAADLLPEGDPVREQIGRWMHANNLPTKTPPTRRLLRHYTAATKTPPAGAQTLALIDRWHTNVRRFEDVPAGADLPAEIMREAMEVSQAAKRLPEGDPVREQIEAWTREFLFS